jgi:cytochrome c biogenesis protein CcmG, thiol:disulfide interchange protein DsbE
MLSGGRLRDQRHGCFAALAFAFIGCASPTSGPPPPSAPSPLLARPAPDFRRPSLDGSTVETGALRGRVVVVDFFEEHCVPCRRSLPALEALHREKPDVVVVGISEDDEVSGARRIMDRYALSFSVVHDEGHALAGRFRVVELPATFVLDGRGIVRWRGTSENADDLRNVIRSAK